MTVYVYSASGDNAEIKVFSSLEKAIDYAKSMYYFCNYGEDMEFKQDPDDVNHWFHDDSEDLVEILKLEIE